MKNRFVVGAALFAALILLGAMTSACATTNEAGSAAETAVNTDAADTQSAPTETKAKPKPKETSGQRNARESAESYLDTAAFSRKSLIQQLKYEGYSKKDAEYAVDAIKVDWNKQAAKSAASYLETSSFSRSALIDQLEYEGFTHSQAVYGVKRAY